MIKLISLSRDVCKGNKTVEATFLKDGELVPLRVNQDSDSSTYLSIDKLLRTPGFLDIDGASDKLYSLMSPVERVESTIKGSYSLSGNLTVQGGVLRFGEFVLEDTLSTHMLSLLNEDSTPKDERLWKSYVRFLDNLFQNVNGEIRSQLFRWMDYENKAGNGFGITEDGCFVGYKGCKGSILEPTSSFEGSAIVDGEEINGRIPNRVGSVIQMPRSSVEFDPSRGCSVGLHVGTRDYAISWAPILTLVKVNPRDVVSVPFECDSQKIRVCEYTVMKVIDASDEHKRFHASTEFEEFDTPDYVGETHGNSLSISELPALIGQMVYVEYDDKSFLGTVIDTDTTSNPGIVLKDDSGEYKHIKLHRLTYWEVILHEDYDGDYEDYDEVYDEDYDEDYEDGLSVSIAHSIKNKEVYIEYDDKRFSGLVIEIFDDGFNPGVILKNDDGVYKHIKLDRVVYWEILDSSSSPVDEFASVVEGLSNVIDSIYDDSEIPF